MNDLLKLNLVELQAKAVDLKKKLAQLRFDKATGKLVDTSSPRKLRKEVARILTRVSQVEPL